MSTRFRVSPRRSVAPVLAACAAISLLFPAVARCQCMSGGTTGSTGGTPTLTSQTSRGTGSTGTRTGSTTTTSSSNVTSLLQAAQMAHQYQLMVEQESRIEAAYVMQAMQYDAAVLQWEQQQAEQRRAKHLAAAQKRRDVQAARARERKTGKQSPRPEVHTASR